MKRIIFLSIIFAFALNAFGQHKMYKFATSGMSKENFYTAVKNDKTISVKHVQTDDGYVTYYDVIIAGRHYIMLPSWNKNNKLNALTFFSQDKFEWYEYDTNIKENLIELYRILSDKYGEPEFDRYYDWTDIPKGKTKTFVAWADGTYSVGLFVDEDDGEYSVGLILHDDKYSDKEDIGSSDF